MKYVTCHYNKNYNKNKKPNRKYLSTVVLKHVHVLFSCRICLRNSVGAGC